MKQEHYLISLILAIVLSLFLHGLGFALFLESPASLIIKHHPLKTQIQKELTLEFIPAPPDAAEKKPLAPTLNVSEHDTTAQNPISKPTLAKTDPYQHGSVEHKSIERAISREQKLSMPQEAKQIPKSIQMIQETAPQPKREDAAANRPVKTSAKKKDKLLKHDPITLKETNTKQDMLEQSKEQQFPKTFSPQKQPLKKNESKALEQEKQQSQSIKKPVPKISKRDDFSSPAQNNPSTTAEILDEWSYNSKSDAVARYFSKEFKKISNLWQLDLLSSHEFTHTLMPKVKETVVVFKIMPDGHYTDLQVVHHEGEELTVRFPVQAIEKAAPFSPLPPDVLSYIRTDGLWICIEFNYTNQAKK